MEHVMSNEPAHFRSLYIWQYAQALAEVVMIEVAKLPHDRSVDAIVAQLLRSAGSVPANFAEGYGRFYQAAYRNHLSIGRGSLYETESWIDLLFRTGYLSAETNARLISSCQELGKLLTSRMKALETKPSDRFVN